MPVRILVTAGTTADCSQAATLIDGLDAQHLLADKGYDTDGIVAKAESQHMEGLFLRRKIGVNSGRMTKRFIDCAIWSKMLFCI